MLPADGTHAVVAIDDSGRRLGAAWWHLHDPALLGPGSGCVPELTIAVIEEARNVGVGSALIEALAVRAADAHERISLNVHVRNPAARLYTRTGFKVAGAGRGAYGVAMTRDLRERTSTGSGPTLVAVTGLPCVGKSTVATEVARRTGLFLIELDHLEAPLLRQAIDAERIGWAGYDMLMELATDNLTIGRSVLFDAVGWTNATRDQWSRLAADMHARFRPIEVICSSTSVHQARVEQRRRDLVGYPETTWQDVTIASTRYEPWLADRLTLDTVEPLSGLIDRALAYVYGTDEGAHGAQGNPASRS